MPKVDTLMENIKKAEDKRAELRQYSGRDHYHKEQSSEFDYQLATKVLIKRGCEKTLHVVDTFFNK